MSQRTILTLIRHGETSANTGGVWHGSIDTELSPKGFEQAARVGEFAKSCHADAAAVYASPLQRARNTAEAIARALGHEVAIESDLSEYDLGSWEGKTYAELNDTHQLWQKMAADADFAPHGGESPAQVGERICAALRRIASAHPGQRVFVVSHGGAMSIGLGLLINGDARRWHRVMDNCASSELVLEPTPELISFNQTAHLGDLGPKPRRRRGAETQSAGAGLANERS